MFFPATIKLICHTISEGHFMSVGNNKNNWIPLFKVFPFFPVQVLLRPIVMKVAMQHKMPVLDHVRI